MNQGDPNQTGAQYTDETAQRKQDLIPEDKDLVQMMMDKGHEDIFLESDDSDYAPEDDHDVEGLNKSLGNHKKNTNLTGAMDLENLGGSKGTSA
jgi:hypothetical protein